jgi:hypothetical protein
VSYTIKEDGVRISTASSCARFCRWCRPGRRFSRRPPDNDTSLGIELSRRQVSEEEGCVCAAACVGLVWLPHRLAWPGPLALWLSSLSSYPSVCHGDATPRPLTHYSCDPRTLLFLSSLAASNVLLHPSRTIASPSRRDVYYTSGSACVREVPPFLLHPSLLSSIFFSFFRWFTFS